MATVQLTGNIDHQTSTKARGRLLAELGRGPELDIDLSGVTRIDSAGLAILVEVYALAHRAGRRVRLLNVNSSLRRLMRLARLEGVFALDGRRGGETLH